MPAAAAAARIRGARTPHAAPARGWLMAMPRPWPGRPSQQSRNAGRSSPVSPGRQPLDEVVDGRGDHQVSPWTVQLSAATFLLPRTRSWLAAGLVEAQRKGSTATEVAVEGGDRLGIDPVADAAVHRGQEAACHRHQVGNERQGYLRIRRRFGICESISAPVDGTGRRRRWSPPTIGLGEVTEREGDRPRHSLRLLASTMTRGSTSLEAQRRKGRRSTPLSGNRAPR